MELSPPLNQSFHDLYGYDDSLNIEKIAEDINYAASDKEAFIYRVDAGGQTLLHFLAWQALEVKTVPLVQRLLDMDMKLAQMLDSNKELPLWVHLYSLSHSSDSLRYVWYNLLEDPPRATFGLGILLSAFPEAIFDEKVLGVLGINRAYQSDDLCKLWNGFQQNIVKNEIEEDKSDDSDKSDEESDEDDESELSSEKALFGLLKLSFVNGLQHIPSSESILKTGKRAFIHIICSHAYEPVFESLFDLVFQPQMASLPDPATAQNLLPLQLILTSPILPHPLVGGRIYGFFKMRQLKRNIPLRVVQKLVDAYPQALTTHDENGYLPVHLAVPHNNLQLLKALLQPTSATMAVQDPKGPSLLFLACQYRCDLDLLYFLVRENPMTCGKAVSTTIYAKAVVAAADTTDYLFPPKIVPIANQTSKQRYTALQAEATKDSSPIDRWGIEIARAWKVTTTKAGRRERIPWILTDGSTPCDSAIDDRTGRITYSGLYTKDAISQLRVTAENAAGWSSIEFEIEFPGDHDYTATR